MPDISAILDTCVLFSATLRDLLLRAAFEKFYTMYLTEEILDELQRNLILKRGVPANKALYLIDTIEEVFQRSFISSHRSFINSMPINEKDRHVLAAAVACNARIIVTLNLKDFPPVALKPFEIEAQSPDMFLTQLFYAESRGMVKLLIEQAGDLHRPAKTLSELLETLSPNAPSFVQLVRNKLEDGLDTDF